MENFSFVFQLNNSHGSINRHEMRAFKKAWAAFDVDGTGYLNRASIVPFLAVRHLPATLEEPYLIACQRLTGIFDVRIYREEYGVRRLMADSAPSGPRTIYSAPIVDNIDIGKLGSILSGIDQRDVAKRRALYNRLYHEATISAESGKGISFTK